MITSHMASHVCCDRLYFQYTTLNETLQQADTTTPNTNSHQVQSNTNLSII